MEIACDESGYEGEKLVGTPTDVFAHGSVAISSAAAAECMLELRARIRSPAVEYKANHLLRGKHRQVLRWFLGPSGPLPGVAHVYLIDKALYLVRVLFPGDVADTLYREGPVVFGRDRWDAFLIAANDVMRARSGPDAFLRTLSSLDDPVVPGELRAALDALRPLSDRRPALDPLIPAIDGTVAFWGYGGTPVSIVHDRQTTLSVERVARLRSADNGQLAGLTLIDSALDPRVQVADIVAGTARKIASDQLNGRGDVTLAALLRLYVDLDSIWADERSWSVLTGSPAPAS